MENPIFREKSLKRMSSPENLEDYIKVANPSIWLLLGAIAIFLISCMIWGKFGKLETTVSVSGIVKNGEMRVADIQSKMEKVDVGMDVKLKGEVVGEVTKVEDLPRGEMEVTIHTYTVANGHYRMHIIAESVEPLSFIFQ